MANKPPYTITERAADSLAKIVKVVTRLKYATGFSRDIRLHRENRLRTIHASLAIEGNSLTLGEVRTIIDGKLVTGGGTEIAEVKNAYAAYDRLMSFDPYAVKDFLKAHALMMRGLIKEAGQFRNGDVAVFDGTVPVHIGARPQFVPMLVEELFTWARASSLHPVLKSAILHYEIETIHPFADGNGRMGRLWQMLLLAQWNPLFAWIPIESLLYRQRPEYYRAIEEARHNNDSAVFIEFKRAAVLRSIIEQEKHQVEHYDEHDVEHYVGLSDAQCTLLRAMSSAELTRRELFGRLGIRGDSRAYRRHIDPLISAGLIEMTLPDKPKSRLQKYRLTEKGRAACGEISL